jgi:hypothetical protein
MTQEAEIRRIVVQSQLRQIVCEALSWEKPFRNKKVGGGMLVEWLKVKALSSNPIPPKKKKNYFCAFN